MARGPSNITDMDAFAYHEAQESFELVEERLARDHVHVLAKEVVQRLAFRMDRSTDVAGMPHDADIARLCAALLSTDEKAADRIILAARSHGAAIETIYLGYVAGASAKLGEMWEADEVSFVDVTLATGRLYRIIRGLRHVLAPVILKGRARMPALFALVPEETHTLGIEMAADLFRRDGADVDVCIGKSHDDIIALSEKHNYGVIVLAAYSDRSLPDLMRLGLALRITQPLTPIALAGKLAIDNLDVRKMIGAELVIDDFTEALPELQRMTAAKAPD